MCVLTIEHHLSQSCGVDLANAFKILRGVLVWQYQNLTLGQRLYLIDDGLRGCEIGDVEKYEILEAGGVEGGDLFVDIENGDVV